MCLQGEGMEADTSSSSAVAHLAPHVLEDRAGRQGSTPVLYFTYFTYKLLYELIKHG